MASKFKSNPAGAMSHLADLPETFSRLVTEVNGAAGSKKETGGKGSTVETAEPQGRGKSSEGSPKEDTAGRNDKEKGGTSKPKARKNALPVQSVEPPSTLTGSDLWEQFVNLCEDDKQIRKDLGRNGSAKLMRIENDIVDTFQMCRVNDNTITTMVNAVLRSFLLHYKSRFLEYKGEQSKTIF